MGQLFSSKESESKLRASLYPTNLTLYCHETPFHSEEWKLTKLLQPCENFPRVLMCGVSHSPSPLVLLPSLSICHGFAQATPEPLKLFFLFNTPHLPSEGRDEKHFFCLARKITTPSQKESLIACFFPSAIFSGTPAASLCWPCPW